MACCILQIGALARVGGGNIEQKRLTLGSRVVVMSIHRGFNLSFCLVCVCVCVYLLNCS